MNLIVNKHFLPNDRFVGVCQSIYFLRGCELGDHLRSSCFCMRNSCSTLLSICPHRSGAALVSWNLNLYWYVHSGWLSNPDESVRIAGVFPSWGFLTNLEKAQQFNAARFKWTERWAAHFVCMWNLRFCRCLFTLLAQLTCRLIRTNMNWLIHCDSVSSFRAGIRVWRPVIKRDTDVDFLKLLWSGGSFGAISLTELCSLHFQPRDWRLWPVSLSRLLWRAAPLKWLFLFANGTLYSWISQEVIIQGATSCILN